VDHPTPQAFDLLTACLRHATAVDLASASVRQLDALAALAAREGVAALALRSLRGSPHPVPESLQASLRAAATRAATRNLRRWQSLEAVLRSLGRARLPVIVLKGAHLAESIYRSLSLRPMFDVDLLIDEADIAAADDALRETGLAAGPRNNAHTRRTHHHFTYYDAEGFAFELHWHLTVPSRARHVDLPGVWRRAVPARIAGCDVRVLCDEDLLLHLAEHAVRHRLAMGLRTLCDVHELTLTSGHRMDWSAAAGRAAELRLSRASGLVLHASGQLLGTPFPQAARSAFTLEAVDPGWSRIAGQEIMAAREPSSNSQSVPLSDLLGAHGIARRARALVGAALPPPAVLQNAYNLPAGSWRTVPYYGLRWGYLLRRYAPGILSTMRDGPRRRAARERVELFDWLDQEAGPGR
jgi:hypothetical protein